MVTHEPVAAAVASRLVVLDDGMVVHDGEGRDADGVLDLMKAVA
jgi:putative ABC transport system ATP-binding protein